MSLLEKRQTPSTPTTTDADVTLSRSRWCRPGSCQTIYQSFLDLIHHDQWPWSKNTVTTTTPRIIPLTSRHGDSLLDAHLGKSYIDNSIRTARYTIYDFIPKQLIFQATRLSNFYFIVVGVPQAIPGFSTTGNYTTILPLVFFMLLTILKEGYDDLRRHRLDKKENRTLARRFGRPEHKHTWWPRLRRRTNRSTLQPEEQHGHDWKPVRWSSLAVGDIIKVQRDEDVPADIVLIHTDSEEHIAYIETMALDGETNLKPRQAHSVLQAREHWTDLLTLDVTVTTEAPNRDLYSFDGKIDLDHTETVPLTLQEVVYRGSTLRNTESIIGLVINTGEECKIRMNANHHPRAKKPRLEHYSNQIVLTLIVYVILLSVGCSVGYILFQRSTEGLSWYLDDAAVPFKQIIIGYGIMFNNVIPLALYVSLEIVKIGQMLLISNDLEMFHEENNAPMRCNTNTILENLGQVSYVLSDKTGTLTQNVMKFKAISVGGFAWHHVSDAARIDEFRSAIKPVDEKKSARAAVTELERIDTAAESSACADASLGRTVFRGTTIDLLRHCRDTPASQLGSAAHEFMLALAVCNTCLPEPVASFAPSWQTSSPDELALVRAANDLGFSLVKRSTTSLLVSTGSVSSVEYEILNVIEFSSRRKRMSIVLRCPDGRIWLLCKGADNVIIPRLRRAVEASAKSRTAKSNMNAEHERQRKSFNLTSGSARPSVTIERIRHSIEVSTPTSGRRREYFTHDPNHGAGRPPLVSGGLHADVFAQCFEHIEKFAEEGLRTLVFAHRYLSNEQYKHWEKLYRDASTSLDSRQERMEIAAENIEQSLELLGATAIEDKLQDHVPQTIEKLRRANIRIWMLTGDKRETAINIAHSARVCRPESNIIVLDAVEGDLEAQLRIAVDEVVLRGTQTVAVIDGHTLSVIEASAYFTKMFFDITPAISSVICCRASPAQKAFIVQAIHKCVPKAVTLAIGDGANDIAMIQAAHVGVGISGKEGLQAARVADYSIAQFSFLQRLLLVHGRWNYIRTAKFILWTFWKEMFFYMMQALYQQYTGYSGSSLYENWSLTALNTLFTSLCVILPGIFEQDLRADTLLTVPELYIYGQTNLGLNLVGYLMWMGGAAIEGLIVWYLPWKLYGNGSVLSDNGAFALGDMMFSIAIVWTNWKLLIIETHMKTKIIIIGFVVTVAGWWIWNIFLAGVYSDNLSPFDVKGGLFMTFGRDPHWWLTAFVTMMVLALLDLSVKAFRRLLIINGYWPLWKRRTESRAQERELEAWQELEQEPGAVARLKDTEL